MRVVRKEFTFPARKAKFGIVPIGDSHLGNVGFDKKKFQEVVDWVKDDPSIYWIGTGDYIDCINPADKRFDPESVGPEYTIKDLSRLIPQQIDDLARLLDPIKKKCLCLVVGNHEEHIRLKFNFDIGYELSKRFNAPLLGYDGWLQLLLKRNVNRSNGDHRGLPSVTYNIYISHGFGGGRSTGPKINRLEEVATYMDADLIILGHGHKRIVAPPILKICLDRNGNVRTRKQIAVMAGSFLKGYVEGSTTYVEKQGYHPSDLGTIKIDLDTDKVDIHCEL